MQESNQGFLKLENFYQMIDLLSNVVKEHRDNSFSEGELLVDIRSSLVDLQKKLEQLEVSVKDPLVIMIAKATKISNELIEHSATKFEDENALVEFKTFWEGDLEIQTEDALISFAKWMCFSPIVDYTQKTRINFIKASYLKELKEDIEQESLIEQAIDKCFELFPLPSIIDSYIAESWNEASAPKIIFDGSKTYMGGLLLQDSKQPVPSNYSYILGAIERDCELGSLNQSHGIGFYFLPLKLDCITSWELD